MLSPELIRFSSATFESNWKDLQEDNNFCDVTIACENQHVKAHKVMLSGGSPLFKNILKQNPQSHPLIFLNDVKFSHLLKMLDFMYQGEVIIDQKELCDFISVANDLKIKGIAKDAAKDLKQSECFIDEGNKSKKQQLINSLNQDVNDDYNINIGRDINKLDNSIPSHVAIDLKVDELGEDTVKDSKQWEHFAHEDNSRKNKPMVIIPFKNLNLDFDIKIEMDGLNRGPIVDIYEEDSNAEKIKEKNQLQDQLGTNAKKGKNILNMGEKRLRIRDIAELSNNTLQSPSISIEEDVLENLNSSNLNGELVSVHERVKESSNENAFMCMHCKRKYSNKWTLKAHIKRFNGDCCYPCDKCDYIAQRKEHLNSHIQSFHDVVTYPCDKCNYTAKQENSLKRHIMDIHDGITYPCNKCDFIAIRRDSLNSHINYVHDGVTYSCEKCDYTVIYKSTLMKHIYKVHQSNT